MAGKAILITAAVGAMAVMSATPASAAKARTSAVVIAIDKGGRTVTATGSHGRVVHVRVSKTTLRKLRRGSRVAVSAGRVVAASGKARSVRLKARIIRRSGRLTAVTTDGTPISVIVGGVTLNLANLAVGQTVAITISFDANGKPVVTVSDPGTSGGSSSGSPSCPAEPVVGTVLAVNRSASKVMVDTFSGGRSTYTIPADSIGSIRRGNGLVITDADSDRTAEAVTVVGSGVDQISGSIEWVDDDWGAFGLRKDDGTLVAVDANACQLEGLAEGDSATAVVHTDDQGEIVADAVSAQSGSDGSSWGDDRMPVDPWPYHPYRGGWRGR